jgi:hypothetical protein
MLLGALIEVTRNADRPDIIVASNDYYILLENQLTSMKRYMDADAADAGFRDEFLYEELALDVDKRRLPVISLMNAEAKIAFEKWKSAIDKKEY